MKKILLILIANLVFILNVNALTTENGVKIDEEAGSNSVELYCEYQNNNYIRIFKGINDDFGEVEPDGLPITDTSYETLRKYNFINDDGSYDCPKFMEFDRATNSLIGYTNYFDTRDTSKYHYSLNLEESSCTGLCSGKNESGASSQKVCDYADATTKNGLFYSGEGNNCTIEYNNQEYNFENNTTCTMINASNACPDIFFNESTKEIEIATYDYNKWFNNNNNYDSDIFNYVCGGNTQPKYFCEASGCEFEGNANINCIDIGKSMTTSSSICSDNNVLKALRFVGYLLFAAKIIIPIILIIMGSIDYGQAIISSDADSVKKATNTFMRRVIAAIIIFFIPTIVNVVFRGLLHFKTFDEYNNCRVCIFNPTKCNINE